MDATELGSEPAQFTNIWAMLVDKGYQGAGRVVRTIQPKKKARGETLDRENLARNKTISPTACLSRTTSAWNENRFDTVVRLCVVLANFHASLMPPHAQDSEHYCMVLATYQSMGDKVRTQRTAAQREYHARQQVCARPNPYEARPRSSQSETHFGSDDEESITL